MSCSRCGSDRLYRFEAGDEKAAATGTVLPVVCRACGCMTVGGQALALPQEMERQAVDMAEAAAIQGKVARNELTADPDTRIEAYMARYYSKAYLDGFFRALVYFRHHGKEGRLRRLRDLWKGFETYTMNNVHKVHENVHVVMYRPEYTEFEQLLFLSAQGSDNASSTPDKR